jgi:hypothetical protein
VGASGAHEEDGTKATTDTTIVDTMKTTIAMATKVVTTSIAKVGDQAALALGL